jgi:hypothetical protein
MNYKINEMNPIEAIRMAERISQKAFAVKLGYKSKDNYQYHMRNFTQDIVDKVKVVYDRDVTLEIINHLKFKCRKLQKQLKQQKKNQFAKSETTAEVKNKSIRSILDKV